MPWRWTPSYSSKTIKSDVACTRTAQAQHRHRPSSISACVAFSHALNSTVFVAAVRCLNSGSQTRKKNSAEKKLAVIEEGEGHGNAIKQSIKNADCFCANKYVFDDLIMLTVQSSNYDHTVMWIRSLEGAVTTRTHWFFKTFYKPGNILFLYLHFHLRFHQAWLSHLSGISFVTKSSN